MLSKPISWLINLFTVLDAAFVAADYTWYVFLHW